MESRLSLLRGGREVTLLPERMEDAREVGETAPCVNVVVLELSDDRGLVDSLTILNPLTCRDMSITPSFTPKSFREWSIFAI